MLRILLDPFKAQQVKKNKNKRYKKIQSNNTSTLDSNISNKNTDYTSTINININNNNIRNNIINDNNKKNIKININYINELIDQLNLNKKNKEEKEDKKNNNSTFLQYKYNQNLLNKQSRNNKSKCHKTYSLDNIYNYSNDKYYNETINEGINKSIVEKTNFRKKIINLNEEHSSLYDFINYYKNKGKKYNYNRKNHSINKQQKYLNNSMINKKYNKPKNKKIFINNSVDKINYNLDGYKYNYNKNYNKKYEDYNYLIVYKKIIEKDLKKSISDLENTIKIFNNNQKRKEEECQKIIYYNKLIISNIEKTRKKINESIIFKKKDNNCNIHNFNYETDEMLNKSIEVNEEITMMKDYIAKINVYISLLNEKITEDIKWNNKRKQNINIYRNHSLNCESKYKILESNTNYIKDILNQVKEYI